jgi:epoxyqueuosine reductase
VGIEQAIKDRALQLGFDLVGIAPMAPGRDLDFAREWVERGFGGEMRYLSNPKRFDPRSVLPSIKSVICVGLIYDTPFPYSVEAVGSGQEAEGSGRKKRVRSQGTGVTKRNLVVRSQLPIARLGRGRTNTEKQAPVSGASGPRAWISRYAWGRDYHEVMRAKLEQLRASVEELAPGTETRVYVDTGPIVERTFARFSGIGWMGKNTCIINEGKGSWIFLGVILTSLELWPDLPAPDRCGSCRACLDSCPTGALVEPYVMDASRCISYLNIELKGSVPQDLRPLMGSNVFGCDICQDVCPWNRRQSSVVGRQSKSFEPMTVSYQRSAVSSQLPADDRVSSIQNRESQIESPPFPNTQPPDPSTFSLFNPPLEALASLGEEDFRRVFAHSPIKRAKFRGWLRNLCVVMGNSGDTRFIPKLKELSHHPDPITREHATWALERIYP